LPNQGLQGFDVMREHIHIRSYRATQ